MQPIVIAGMARTPMGGFMGALSRVPAPELGAAAIGAALERAGVGKDKVDQVTIFWRWGGVMRGSGTAGGAGCGPAA